MENELNIKLNVKELSDIVKSTITSSIERSLAANKENIEKQISSYFAKPMFANKESEFESALDWAIEQTFRLGLDSALKEMNFSEVVANRAKEILSDNTFISNLAEVKIRQSLGLPSIEKPQQ